MKHILLLFIIVICGCDSPMNNRVNENNTKTTKATTLTFTDRKLRVEAEWTYGPFGSIQKNNHLLVILKNEQGEPESLPSPLTLNFYATMPSMGHPMEDAGFFEEIDKGIYINKTIRYNMPGDWKNELWIMDENYNVLEKVEWLEFF